MRKFFIFYLLLSFSYSFIFAQVEKGEIVNSHKFYFVEQIHFDSDPVPFALYYPEKSNIGRLRLSFGIEPILYGFFSYCFDYNFRNLNKGAIYLVISKKIDKFEKMVLPVYGDKSNNLIRIRIIDKDGEVFTTALKKGVVSWEKWKNVVYKISDFKFTKWAETKKVNGKIDFPILLRRIYFVKSVRGKRKGKIYIDDLKILK